LGSLWFGCRSAGVDGERPSPNWSESLGAGKQAQLIEGAWRDGGDAGQLATESRLLKFIERYPYDPQCVGMRLRLAWLRVRQRRVPEATVLVESVRLAASGVDADWVTLLDGAILREQRQPAKALEGLLRLNGKLVDATLRELWSVETVKAALEVSRFDTALELMVGYRAYGRDERLSVMQAQIKAWVAQIPEAVLSRALAVLSEKATRPAVDEGLRQSRALVLETLRSQLATVALERQDPFVARQVLNSGSPRFKRSELGEKLRRLAVLAEPTTQTLQAAVGVLLEMQDDFSSRRSAEIITGAMRALDESHETVPIRLISHEIRETTDTAIRSGLEALIKDGAAIIISGVTSATAQAATKLAETEQAIVITLSDAVSDASASNVGELNYLYRVADVTQVIEQTVPDVTRGGPLRLTMQNALCTRAQPDDKWFAALATSHDVLLLTDEECANRFSVQLNAVKSSVNVWLGPEAVGAVERFSAASIVTSPSLLSDSSSASVKQWQERFQRRPFWYEALGYDVVELSALALRATSMEVETTAAAIARQREQIALALGRAQTSLLTSSSSGFDRGRRLRPTTVHVTTDSVIKEKTGS
jgi:hypothetical protein